MLRHPGPGRPHGSIAREQHRRKAARIPPSHLRDSSRPGVPYPSPISIGAGMFETRQVAFASPCPIRLRRKQACQPATKTGEPEARYSIPERWKTGWKAGPTPKAGPTGETSLARPSCRRFCVFSRPPAMLLRRGTAQEGCGPGRGRDPGHRCAASRAGRNQRPADSVGDQVHRAATGHDDAAATGLADGDVRDSLAADDPTLVCG